MRFIGTGLLFVAEKTARGEAGHVRLAGERRFFVDTRQMGDGKPPKFLEPHPLEEPEPQDVRHAALFIDLGSTRTLGLVVPDKEAEWDAMQCRTLELVDYADTNDEAPGPFSSQVVLERPAEGIVDATWPLSEVRTGMAAAELYNYAAYTLTEAGGRGIQLMASSPKRMIARTNKDRTWRTIGRQHGGTADARRVLQCYQAPYEEDRRQAEGLVPARLVGMQVVELLEQAERMLNSQEEVHAYRVDEVHVTYPPGWLGPVQENYKQLIQTEVDKWARARALTVKVEMGCSEALGALVFHWYNRRLNELGRSRGTGAEPVSTEETLAVVDVGGGTSDLLIEQISFDQHTFLFKPVRRQSEETAGDELVRRVAVELVLPAIIHHQRYAEGEQPALEGYLQDDEHVTEKRLWMRKELQPLAQCFTQAAGATKLSETDKLYVREHLEVVIGKLDAVVKKNDRRGKLSDAIDELERSILREAREKVAVLAKAVFEPLAESFAEICRRHGCTEIKLSGKAMDYQVVQDVFQKAFRSHGLANVGLLVGQPVAEELRPFLGCDTVRDSKYATVWGSICKWLMERNRAHFAEGWGIYIMDVVGRPSWYLHGMASRLTRNDCARLDPVGSMPITIPTLPQALSYVVCKEGEKIREDDGGDAPVRMFKLAFKNPDMRLAPNSQRPEILLESTPDGKFMVSRVQYGRVVMRMGNGEADLLAGDLEITPALDYSATAFWLDSGKVELRGYDGSGHGSGSGGTPPGTSGSSGSGNGGGAKGPGHRPTEMDKPPAEENQASTGRADKANVVVKLGKSKKGESFIRVIRAGIGKDGTK